MPTKPCPFCHLGPERIAGSNATGLIVRDAYPVTPGHTLIIPRRHVGRPVKLTSSRGAIRKATWRFTGACCRLLRVVR